MPTQRLQKVMADSGVASRRRCEEMILEGLVKVNGSVVIKLPVLVDPLHDHITVSGRKLKAPSKLYYLINKPRKVVCTNSDPEGRRRAIDLLPGNIKQRLYTVGRLDADSQGLLILTNDGELANQLTHPSFGVPKTYVAEISTRLEPRDIARLRKGLHLPQGKAAMEAVKVLRSGPRQSLLEITLREGRNRQIRVMLARLGHSVRRLTRVRIAHLTLGGLASGKARPLTSAEVKKLRTLAVKQPESITRKKRVRRKSTRTTRAAKVAIPKRRTKKRS